ncbi:heme-binding domain-containing protein [Soonwooa purpurea]
MRKTIKILISAIAVFGLIQLVPIDRNNEPVRKEENFVDLHKTNPQVVTLLRAACYDCHSNEVNYPDYAFVAPISWLVKDHVREGRDRLNFSKWGTYNLFQKQGMLERSISTTQNYTMPMPVYIQKHPEANLSKAQRELLVGYFREILNAEKP